MIAIKSILYPTDFSEASIHAFDFACSLARDHNARLVLFHTVPPMPAIAHPGVAVPLQDAKVQRAESDRKLQEMQGSVDGIEMDCQIAENEEAGRAIVNAAKAMGSDLIVMGTHGRSGLRRLLMGSVAEQVLRHAHCPVMSVKTPSNGSQ